jgi:hypothetical protein
VRTRASFHANYARRQVYKEPTHLAAVDLSAQYDFAVAIHPVQLKTFFAKSIPMVAIFMAGAPIPS